MAEDRKIKLVICKDYDAFREYIHKYKLNIYRCHFILGVNDLRGYNSEGAEIILYGKYGYSPLYHRNTISRAVELWNCLTDRGFTIKEIS